MNASKIFAILGYSLTLSITSCGFKNDRELDRKDSSTILTNENLQTESVNLTLTEALEALGDSSSSNQNQNQDGFALQEERNRTRSCAEEDGKAVVSIDRDINHDREWDQTRIHRFLSINGQEITTRIWSHTDRVVNCYSSGTHALISRDETMVDTKLAINFSRLHKGEMTRTLKTNNMTENQTFRHEAIGDRTIIWTSYRTEEDGNYTLSKNLESMVNRTHQIKTDENESELTLRIGTESSSPLAITETRHRDSHELLRKTISSGELIANSGSGEKIVTTFDQFTIAFTESDCTFDSGTLTVSFFAPGSNEASKILKLEATNANYTVIDITNPEDPTILNDFEGTVCNLSDFKI